MLLLAGLLSVSFFFPTSHWTSWSWFTKTLFATSRSCVAFIPVKPSSFWSFHWMSTQDWARKAALIICWFLAVSGLNEVYVRNASHSLIKFGGGVSSAFWIILVILDILVGFLAPAQSPFRRASWYQPRISCPCLVLKSQLGLVFGITSRAHPSVSKTSVGACPQSHFWDSV